MIDGFHRYESQGESVWLDCLMLEAITTLAHIGVSEVNSDCRGVI